MSQENVEIVCRAIDLVNGGELRRAIEGTDEAFEMDWSDSIGPVSGVYRGRDQVLGLLETFSEAWDELRWEVQEVIDLDRSDQVLVVNKVRMRGRVSHAIVEATGAQLWTIRHGKPWRAKLYQSKADALEAAGLSE